MLRTEKEEDTMTIMSKNGVELTALESELSIMLTSVTRGREE